MNTSQFITETIILIVTPNKQNCSCSERHGVFFTLIKHNYIVLSCKATLITTFYSIIRHQFRRQFNIACPDNFVTRFNKSTHIECQMKYYYYYDITMNGYNLLQVITVTV